MATPLPLAPLLSDDAYDRLRRLLFSTAHATGAPGGLLLLCKESTWQVAVVHGAAVPSASAGQILARLSLCPLAPGISHQKAVDAMMLEACPWLNFVATASICDRGEVVGILLVCDTGMRSLTAAQHYVLLTMAAAIGDQLKFQQKELQEAAGELGRSASEERLRLLESVVVNAHDAVLITEAEPTDLPGPRIIYANAAFARTTGYSMEEIVGQTPRILHGPRTDRALLDKLKAALLRWEPVEVELLNYRKDGTPFWVELSIVPVANETGWYTHWVSVQRDVSERKANEETALRFRLAEAHNEALANEIRERIRSEQELAYAAFHDSLTGLRNRAYFMDRLKLSVDQASGGPASACAVVFLDLDDFKGINDRFGHRVGDLMLVEVARRLQANARPGDTIARMGGDEFTVLLSGIVEPAEAVAVIERLSQALGGKVMLGGNEVALSASLGLSMGTYTEAEHILRDADIAMYRAKEEGGARYAVFNEQMHEKAMAALQIRQELCAGLDLAQFELYYQPLVQTSSEEISGVEALVRWHHPTRGLVAPLDFIAIAEKTGLIVPLGAWVLAEACRHLSVLRRSMAKDRPFKMSVNVSTCQLDDPSFFVCLEEALRMWAVDPRDLQLEITESVYLNDPETVGELLLRIRQLGVHIACDDFGTGYSSLSYLQLYPIDTIKIDQAFVRQIDRGGRDADIVRMIIALAQALSMHVSAEGVEDICQRDVLRELGCTEVQGYLYSRPVPLEEILRMLHRNYPQRPTRRERAPGPLLLSLSQQRRAFVPLG